MIKRLYRYVKEFLKKRGAPHDRISINESIKIALVKDGKTVEVFEGPVNTWTTWGLRNISYFLTGVSAYYPNAIKFSGNTVSISKKVVDDTIVVYNGTIPSDALGTSSRISLISTVTGGTFSNYEFGFTYVKYAGYEMRIEWRNTITSG